MTNLLYYGDNIEILRDISYFPDNYVDLIYLDPPFNSNRNYNILFSEKMVQVLRRKYKYSKTVGNGIKKVTQR